MQLSALQSFFCLGRNGLPSVSFYPCSACGERARGKLATIYWAWFTPDQGRYAVRQRLCAPCYVRWYATPITDQEANPEACPYCHGSVGPDVDPTYATVYIPGREFIEVALATCANDAAVLRENAKMGAIPLPDRESVVGGPQPPNSATSVWDDLGLRP